MEQNPLDHIPEDANQSLLRIRAVFSDDTVLERVATSLQSKGLITGFQISEITSGYRHEKQDHFEKQFALSLFIPPSIPADRKNQITTALETAIGEHWDVPAIEEEHITVNNDFLQFVHGLETHNSTLRRFQRRVRNGVVAVAGVIGLGSIIGGTAYVQHQQDTESSNMARKLERQKIYAEIAELELQSEHITDKIQAIIRDGKSFTIVQPDQFGVTNAQEVTELRDKIRRLETRIRALRDSE